ncbi:MAG: hypothetical protein GC185_05705 [Alphaproteobacteria bacterium]|nr:hypothetical protein [Alphaproteobacteria bacterium]
MPSAPAHSPRILLTGLPAPLEKALREQLAEAGPPGAELATSAAEGDAPFDLVICGDAPDAGAEAAPGTPRLEIDHGQRHRLGVILRQARQMLEEPALYLDGFPLGDYFFNPAEKLLAAEGREDIPLTDKEVDILVYLARHHARAVTRDDLLQNVWRYQQGVDTHTLETHIYRLRQKMESSAENPELLVTVETGYRLMIQKNPA